MFNFSTVRIDRIHSMTISCSSVSYSYILTGFHFGFRSRRSFFHVTDIRRIAINCSAACNIGDLFSACVNTTGLRYTRTTING